MVFDYLDAGADDEITIRRNKDAYSQHELIYRVLAGLAPPLDLSTRIWTVAWRFRSSQPPPRAVRCSTPTGRSASTDAAAAHGAMYRLSTMATSSPPRWPPPA